MNKDGIILTVKNAIANNSIPFNDSDEFVKLDGYDVDNIADEVYETLYNAGYRKVPNDVRELLDMLAEGATIKEKLDEIKRLEKVITDQNE